MFKKKEETKKYVWKKRIQKWESRKLRALERVQFDCFAISSFGEGEITRISIKSKV